MAAIWTFFFGSSDQADKSKENEMLKTALTHALTAEEQSRNALEEARTEVAQLRVIEQDLRTQLIALQQEVHSKKVVPFLKRVFSSSTSTTKIKKARKNDDAAFTNPNDLPTTLEPSSVIRNHEGHGLVSMLYGGSPLGSHSPESQATGSPDIPLLADLRDYVAPELVRLARATADLQQAVNGALQIRRARQLDQYSATVGKEASSSQLAAAPPAVSPRNVRLLVALWEVQKAEGASLEVASLMRSLSPNNAAAVDCPICMDAVEPSDVVEVDGCRHALCKECLAGHIQAKIGEGTWPILCPICVAAASTGRPSCEFIFLCYCPYTSRRNNHVDRLEPCFV